MNPPPLDRIQQLTEERDTWQARCAKNERAFLEVESELARVKVDRDNWRTAADMTERMLAGEQARSDALRKDIEDVVAIWGPEVADYLDARHAGRDPDSPTEEGGP